MKKILVQVSRSNDTKIKSKLLTGKCSVLSLFDVARA